MFAWQTLYFEVRVDNRGMMGFIAVGIAEENYPGSLSISCGFCLHVLKPDLRCVSQLAWLVWARIAGVGFFWSLGICLVPTGRDLWLDSRPQPLYSFISHAAVSLRSQQASRLGGGLVRLPLRRRAEVPRTRRVSFGLIELPVFSLLKDWTLCLPVWSLSCQACSRRGAALYVMSAVPADRAVTTPHPVEPNGRSLWWSF